SRDRDTGAWCSVPVVDPGPASRPETPAESPALRYSEESWPLFRPRVALSVGDGRAANRAPGAGPDISCAEPSSRPTTRGVKERVGWRGVISRAPFLRGAHR